MASGTRTASITATSTASPARCAPAAAPSSNPRSGRAVGTKEAQPLPGVADEVHPIHDGPSTEMLPQAARLEECRHVCHCIGPADRRRRAPVTLESPLRRAEQEG